MSDESAMPSGTFDGTSMNGHGRSSSDGGTYPDFIYAEPSEKEMSIHDVIEILLKGKWIITAALVSTVLAVAAYTFSQDPVYEAISVIHVTNEGTSPQLNELIGTQQIDAARSIATEIEIIKSLASARRAAQVLLATDLDTTAYYAPADYEGLPIFETEDGDSIDADQLAGRLYSRIEVRPVSVEVDLIQITARSTVPEEAQLIANLYARTYRDFSLGASRERMTASRQFLDEISTNFSDQLKVAEDELTNFLNEEQIVEPDAEARQILQQLSVLQQQHSQTHLQLGVAQSELSSLENELDRITPGLAARISSSDNLVIDQLKQQIANLQFEEQQIYASHPERRAGARTGRLAEIESELAELSRQLDDMVERLVGPSVAIQVDEIESNRSVRGIAASTEGLLQAVDDLRGRITDKTIDISSLQTRLRIIDDQLNEYKARLSSIPAKSIILQRLQRSQNAQEQLYLSLMDELQQARIAERSELGSIKVVDEAGLPSTPVSPRVPQNLVFGTVFGLLLGIGLAFVRNAFDDKIRKPDDFAELNLNVLGVIPRLDETVKKNFGSDTSVLQNGREYSTMLVGLLLPMSGPTQAYRALRVNIQFTRHHAGVKTVVFTSSEPGEGKTLTALNVALLMAQAGNRTVYVDADLHRPRGHSMLDIPREPGLTDLLLSGTLPDLACFRTDVENFSLIPAGQRVPTRAEMLGSNRMRELLHCLRDTFDVVVVDTPPLLAVIDAVVLASMSDATVLVCGANRTHRKATEHALEKLRQVDAPVAGVVLNRFDAVKAYGGRRYGQRYGYVDYGYGEPVGGDSSGSAGVQLDRLSPTHS